MRRNSSLNFNIPYITISSCKIDNDTQFDILLKFFKSQEYHEKKLEWIIIDDACKDLELYIRNIIKNDKRIKYFRYPYKLTIGQKRNLVNKFANGEFIVNFDNYNYYPKSYVHCMKSNKLEKESIFAPLYKYLFNLEDKKVYNCKLTDINNNFCTIDAMAYRTGLIQTNSYDDTDTKDEEIFFLKNYSHKIKRLPSKFCPIQIENKNLNKSKILKKCSKKILDDDIIDQIIYNFDNDYFKSKIYEKNDDFKISDDEDIVVVYTGFIGSESYYCNKYIAEKIFPKKKIIYNPFIEIFNEHNIKYVLYDNDVKLNYYLDKLDCYKIFIGRNNKDYSYINCNFLIDCKKYKNYFMADNFLYIPKYIMNSPLRKNMNIKELINEKNNINKNKKFTLSEQNINNNIKILFEHRYMNNEIYDTIKKLIKGKINISCICPGFINIDNKSDSLNYYSYDNNLKPSFIESYEKLLSNYKFGLCYCENTENFNSYDYIDSRIISCFIAGTIPILIRSSCEEKDIEKHLKKNMYIDGKSSSLINNIKNFYSSSSYYKFISKFKINKNIDLNLDNYLKEVKKIIEKY